METAQAVLAGIAPTGKNLVFIVSSAAAMFMAGIGFSLGLGETAESIEAVPSLARSVEDHGVRISRLETRIVADSAATHNALDRIRCLAALSATGQTVDPLQIDDVCP